VALHTFILNHVNNFPGLAGLIHKRLQKIAVRAGIRRCLSQFLLLAGLKSHKDGKGVMWPINLRICIYEGSLESAIRWAESMNKRPGFVDEMQVFEGCAGKNESPYSLVVYRDMFSVCIFHESGFSFEER